MVGWLVKTTKKHNIGTKYNWLKKKIKKFSPDPNQSVARAAAASRCLNSSNSSQLHIFNSGHDSYDKKIIIKKKHCHSRSQIMLFTIT